MVYLCEFKSDTNAFQESGSPVAMGEGSKKVNRDQLKTNRGQK